MRVDERGVSSELSYMGIANPTTFARESLYYISYYGYYVCNENYLVCQDEHAAEMFTRFLFFYLNKGSLIIESGGRVERAKAGAFVILDLADCPIRYYCDDMVDFYWFYASGNNLEKYCSFLLEKYGSSVISTEASAELKKYVDNIFRHIEHETVNEHYQSLQIAQCLAGLATDLGREAGTSTFSNTLRYIRGHFHEQLSLDDLAEVSGFSKSYFINEFKKEVGSTPHDYLLAYRLHEAKELLRTSRDSVELIAEKCGFNSASHFARAFKKETHMTPLKFRNARF